MSKSLTNPGGDFPTERSSKSTVGTSATSARLRSSRSSRCFPRIHPWPDFTGLGSGVNVEKPFCPPLSTFQAWLASSLEKCKKNRNRNPFSPVKTAAAILLENITTTILSILVYWAKTHEILFKKLLQFFSSSLSSTTSGILWIPDGQVEKPGNAFIPIYFVKRTETFFLFMFVIWKNKTWPFN